MPSLQPSNAIPLTQLTLLGTAIGASYTYVGTFSSSLELMTIVSTMDAAVQVSYDGINDHQAVPIGNSNPAIIPLNFKSNLMTLPLISIYAKRIGTPTVGSLYVSGFNSALQ